MHTMKQIRSVNFLGEEKKVFVIMNHVISHW